MTIREHRTSEEKIRKRAYHIWEQEGRPQGREADHWHRAVRELEGQPDELVRAGVEGAAQPQPEANAGAPAKGRTKSGPRATAARKRTTTKTNTAS